MRLALIALVTIAAMPALAGPIETSFSGTNPVAITGLTDENGCFPAKLAGRIVKRTFDANAIKVSSIVVEERSGERTFVNIDTNKLDKADNASLSNAIRGMQVLLKEGNRISAGIYACGAAGRVIMLDSVRLAR